MQRAPCPALSPLGTRVSQTFRVRAALYPVPPAGRKVKRLPWRLPCRFLMRVLDSYGDDYRSSQFTIVLEVSWGRGVRSTTSCCDFVSPGIALAPLLKITVPVALSGPYPAPLVCPVGFAPGPAVLAAVACHRGAWGGPPSVALTVAFQARCASGRVLESVCQLLQIVC